MRRVAVALSLLLGTLVGLTAPAQAVTTCKETGEGCAVGMVGPGGGVVFYDAGSQQW